MHEPLAPAGSLAAARAGVPAVLVENALFDGPLVHAAAADHMDAALRRHGLVAASGGGLAVAATDITAVALTGLVADADLAAGARKVQAEIAAMPTPEALVPELAALP